MKRRRISYRLHAAKSQLANTAYWWHKGYSLRMAWHLAKRTIN